MLKEKILNSLKQHTFILIFFMLTVLANHALCKDRVEVNFKHGALLGKVEKSFFKNKVYYAFKGVPYAEPPLGELRFQPSRPYKEWDGTYKAFKDKPTCMQFSFKMRNDEMFGISGSEDCLYLSIYTPGLGGSYPVVVFDYNDNFKTGFNGSKTYSPDFFIEEETIVVHISHRLGVFGYLTTEDDVIPGNNGIKDFILGLNWIKDNINKFGGDHSKITLMGDKGGAALASLLLYSEKAKGLFSSVILQSGTALEPIYFYSNPKSKAFELAQAVNIKVEDSKTLHEELIKLDAEQLLLKAIELYDNEGLKLNQRNAEIFGPIVEREKNNAVITNLPEKSKIISDVPVLIGFTSREGLDLMADFFYDPKIFERALGGISIQLPIRVNFRFDANSTIFNGNARKEINEVYYRAGYLHLKNMLEYAVLLGDTFVGYAVDKTSKLLSHSIESPVYYYMFDYRGTLNENMGTIAKYSRIGIEQWGATVTDDICYLHLCARIKKTYEEIKDLVTEQTEFKVLKKMMRLWTNFAKKRNPTPDQEDNILKGINWTPIDKESDEVNYLHITKIFKMKKEPLGSRAKFWNDFLNKYSESAINGVVTDPMNSVTDVNNSNDIIYDKYEKDRAENCRTDETTLDTSFNTNDYRNDPSPVVKVENHRVVVEIDDSPGNQAKLASLPSEETHDEL